MYSKEQALNKIKSLVERFDEQNVFYKNKDYNETQTRRDFIDPFWKALGWDVDNENSSAESYREVIHEDRVKVGGATKAPDYSFRLPGGKRLFFLEAKKPSVSIKDEIQPAYQVRRYGWSAKMPISVVSDFEEFAIYDCTNKPKPTDKASTSRIKYLTYSDYIKEFDFIWDTFSKERVLKGSFDKFIANDKNKKGTTSVDSDFLASLDKWRIEIAKNIVKLNEIDEEQLNFVVQNTIDRLIFLRIAEDRNIEPYEALKSAIQGSHFYKKLLRLFDEADEKYNSGLFDFKKDAVSKQITIDDKVLKEIILELYYPLCPYEFSVLSVEILGSAYEQFLGKTISLSNSGKTAKIEEKPEVRKAGGVYYTPQYIVDYIVENTVGKLVENKTPKDVEKIKICDPACGSGSFLIGAYDFLLDWHKKYYKNTVGAKRISTSLNDRVSPKTNPLTPIGELTAVEKKRILLNNIYGVDLDANAVEVTKLSLLLKCMEGETQDSIEAQTKLFHDRILPTLDNNIKCGNSLIDLDYYDHELNFGEERKIKPFSWEKAFPEVFNRKTATAKRTKKDDIAALIKKTKHHARKAYEYAAELEETLNFVAEHETPYDGKGGFDCVIGNPPYVMTELNESQKRYLVKKYKFQEGKPDLYRYFVEFALSILNPNGYFSFIIPNSILSIPSCKSLRKHILDTNGVIQIVDFWGQIFKGVSINSIILTTQRQGILKYLSIINDDSTKPTAQTLLEASVHKVQKSVNEILNNETFSFIATQDNQINKLIDKIKNASRGLSEVSSYTLGMQAYHNSIHEKTDIENRIYHSKNRKNKTYFPEVGGANVNKYLFVEKYKEWVSYGEWCYNKPDWKFCSEERILIREIPSKQGLICCLTSETNIPNKATIIVIAEKITNHFLLGLLNSKLIGYYIFNSTEKGKQRLFPRVSLTTIKNIPIPKIIPKKTEAKIIQLVDQLLQLNKELQTETLPNRIEQLQQRIAHCEDRINEMVYALYGLTEKDIEVIEK